MPIVSVRTGPNFTEHLVTALFLRIHDLVYMRAYNHTGRSVEVGAIPYNTHYVSHGHACPDPGSCEWPDAPAVMPPRIRRMFTFTGKRRIYNVYIRDCNEHKFRKYEHDSNREYENA